MPNQYQPTSYYDWNNRTHGVHLDSGNYQYVPYDYYAGDELHIQNVVFRESQYVTYDNTHVRFLNKSDIHVYDTSNLVIHDSGTLSMYTSASSTARKFVVDEFGRVGIGLDHANPVSNRGESPSFDLDVRGQVGVEDYIYHNDDTDTYMLFGSDLSAHYVNTVGEIHDIYPDDQDEINFRVGGIDMLQMQSRDVDHVESGTVPVHAQDHVTFNKYQTDVDFVVRSETNTGAIVVSGDGSEVVINEDGNSDTDFRVESDHEDHMLFVDTSVNRISIGDSEDTPQATLEITNDPDSGAFDVPLLQLNNKDTDKQLLDINADNINADVINVTADDLTTGDVLNVTADSLTTGSLIHMTHTGSDKSEVSLVHFESTGDRGDDSNQTVLLDLNLDTTDGTGARALRIDSEQTTGTVVEIDAQRITSGTAMTVSASDLTSGIGFELGLDSRTTGTGLHIKDTHDSDNAGALVKIEQTGDRDGSQASIGVDINFDTTANANARALRIDSEQTTGKVVEVNADEITTGEAIRVDADKLTTGSILHLESNSDRTATRSLFRLNNDNTSATKTTLAHIRNDAIADGIETVLIESTAADTNPLLELRNSNAAHDTPALLNFKRSNTNEQHDMDLGTITFEGTDSGNIDTVYAAISAQSTDKDDTNEAGQLSFMIQATDSPSQLRNVLSLGAQKNTSSTVVSTQAEVVINEDQIDIDFRVESNTTNNAFIVYGDGSEVVVNENGKDDTDFRVEGDTTPNLLLVDTSENHVKISGAANDNTDLFTVLGNSDGNTIEANLFKVNPEDVVVNESSNDVNFRVESDTNSSALYVDGAGTEVVVNDTGRSDTDFRVESSTSIAFASDDHPTGQLTHSKTHALFVNTATGGVGLGTSSPDATLHVVGDTHIEGDLWIKGETNQMDTLVHVTSAMDILNKGTGPALTVTQTGSQKVATFMDDTVPALVIEDGGANRSGFVGLGLADPTRNLHIHRLGEEATDHAYAQFTTGDTGDTIADGLHVGYDASEKAIINNKEKTDLIIKTNNTTALTVSGDGQHVAIGSSGHTYTTLYVEATDGLRVPIGNVAQRPLPSAFDITVTDDDHNNFASGTSESAPMLGTIRYNTEHSTFEGFGAGNQWGSLGGVIDVDRDTYWTAVNDLNNLHDLGGEKEGTDEFDPNDEYPGDVDYLRAFTAGYKRYAITSGNHHNYYTKTSGTGTTASPYEYTTYLKIKPYYTGLGVYSGAAIGTPQKHLQIEALGDDGTMELYTKTTMEVTAGTTVTVSAQGTCTIDANDVVMTADTVKVTNHNASNKGLKLGSTLITATGAELNLMDGSATTQATVTLATDDGVVINDNGNMTQCLVSDFTTRLSQDITNLPNLVETGALATGSIASGFGTITTGNNISTTAALAGGTATIGTLGTLDTSLAGTAFKLSIGGNVRADGDVIAFATSDKRLKDNVTPILDPIDKINKIGGYTFDWNDKSQFTGHDVGVLAQEVEEILPEVVTTRDDGHKAVKYEKMIPLLIECIKSQQKQIDELKEKISE